jgi:hypothetical protein
VAFQLEEIATSNMRSALRQDVSDHLPMHIRQPEVAAAVTVSEALVVESHLVQDRGVQVVDMHRLFVKS